MGAGPGWGDLTPNATVTAQPAPAEQRLRLSSGEALGRRHPGTREMDKPVGPSEDSVPSRGGA